MGSNLTAGCAGMQVDSTKVYSHFARFRIT